MITGDLKAQIDKVWEAFWTGGLSNPITVIEPIINFLQVKGMIDPAMLFESPFTDINSNGVAGLFEEQMATKIISLIEAINHNAEVA